MKIVTIELNGPYPISTYATLLKSCAEIFQLEPANVAIAKYIPHKFYWQTLLPYEEKKEKNARRKKKKNKALDDIRLAPYFFKEGGIYERINILIRHYWSKK